MKVKIGTLRFEQGTFEAGSIITVSEEQFKQFDPNTVEVLAEPEPAETPQVTMSTPVLEATAVPETPPSEPVHTGAPQAKPRRAPKES